MPYRTIIADLMRRRDELEKETAALEAQIEELQAKQNVAGVVDDTRLLAQPEPTGGAMAAVSN